MVVIMEKRKTKTEIVRMLLRDNELAAEDEEDAISEYFTNAQLEQIRQALGVPDDLPVRIEVSEPYYWEGGAVDLCAVDFYHNENWIAGAACEPHTAETVKDIYMYSPEN